eukprot:973979-Alexandrium_andersonii.AAC.1
MCIRDSLMLGAHLRYFAQGGPNALAAKKPFDLPPQKKKPSRGALPLYKLRLSWYAAAKFDGFAHGRVAKSKPRE